MDVKPDLARIWQWNQSPDVADVVIHLKNVVDAYSPDSKAQTMSLVQKVYQFFESFTVHAGTTEVLQMLEDIGLKHWCWTGDGFTKLEQMVANQNSTTDMRPHTYIIPREISQNKEFFLQCGMAKWHSPVVVLKYICEWHKREDCSSHEVQRDIHLAVQLLE
jgi:DUF1365 family protein